MRVVEERAVLLGKIAQYERKITLLERELRELSNKGKGYEGDSVNDREAQTADRAQETVLGKVEGVLR